MPKLRPHVLETLKLQRADRINIGPYTYVRDEDGDLRPSIDTIKKRAMVLWAEWWSEEATERYQSEILYQVANLMMDAEWWLYKGSAEPMSHLMSEWTVVLSAHLRDHAASLRKTDTNKQVNREIRDWFDKLDLNGTDGD